MVSTVFMASGFGRGGGLEGGARERQLARLALRQARPKTVGCADGSFRLRQQRGVTLVHHGIIRFYCD